MHTPIRNLAPAAFAEAASILVLIEDNETGIHVSAFARLESAQHALRTCLAEYSQCTEAGVVSRYTAQQIEACVLAGTTDELDMPNSDAYRIELVDVRP